jgi:hypothetical protein
VKQGKVTLPQRKGKNTMVQNSKQNWNTGSVVKIGFMSLRVVAVRAEYDYLPDIYTMESMDGKKKYEFIPHNGLTRIN